MTARGAERNEQLRGLYRFRRRALTTKDIIQEFNGGGKSIRVGVVICEKRLTQIYPLLLG